MTHKEKLEICEMINRNKHKIIRLENALRDDKLTTQEFQFVTESRHETKMENEYYTSLLEAGLNTDELGSVYEQTPAKKPFTERYLIPLLFVEGVLTIALMYIWRH